MNELKNRAIQAAEKFVTARGYEILDSENGQQEEDLRYDLVARDEDAVVFITVKARMGGDSLPEEACDRKALEANAASWLKAHAAELDGDVHIRFDAISMLVIGEDRALVRHHINCLGDGNLI